MVIRYFLFVLLILSCRALHAEEIQKNEASIVASNWLNKMKPFNSGLFELDNVYTISHENVNVIHVVTFKPRGWVMVSVTEKAEPVLAYSFISLYDITNLPLQFNDWISTYSKEIASVKKNSIEEPNPVLISKWDALKSNQRKAQLLKSANSYVVEPMLSTTWNTGVFYNGLAPLDEVSTAGNDHAWLGCVAGAMAQLMKYWEYPKHGYGHNSYTHEKYGTIDVDFSSATYDWSSMPNKLTEDNLNVQSILYHAAVAVNMDFGPYYSGAYIEDANSALIKNFGYNPSIYYTWKKDWEIDEWMNLLKDELKKGRPFIYGGANIGWTNAHAFICDGYDNDYFHFNWGWGGYADGYFLLSALNPTFSNFNHHQSAMLGIEPIKPVALQFPFQEGFELCNNNEVSVAGVANCVQDVAHSGSSSLCLSKPGDVIFSKNSISLIFEVPNNGNLSFWVKRNAVSQSSRNNQSASLFLEGETIPFLTFFEGDFYDDDWVNFTCDLSSKVGQNVSFQVAQENGDFLIQSWLYVDDVVVTSGNQNLAPYKPEQPTPENNELLVPLAMPLKWNGGDPNGDSLTYNVYLDTISPPAFYATVKVNQLYAVDIMHEKQYFWKVVSNDGEHEISSDLWSFTTQNSPPKMAVCGINDVASHSVTVCGSFEKSDDIEIFSSGICYGVSEYPTTDNRYVNSAIQLSPYECAIENLIPFTKYYLRAYTENSEGITYSEQDSFITKPYFADLSFLEVNTIKRTSSVAVGKLNNLFDDQIVRVGAAWSIEKDFDVQKAEKVYTTNQQVRDTFEVFMIDLVGQDSIYVRLFVQNSVGISYSEELGFFTANTKPYLDLDADNSSFNTTNGYNGVVHEQVFDGFVADSDVTLFDFDDDPIVQLTCVLSNQVEDEHEFLSYVGLDTIDVVGNNSDTLQINSMLNRSVSEWNEILQRIVVYIDSDNPNTSKRRRVSVTVSDGFNTSSPVFSMISAIAVNDPPLLNDAPHIDSIAFVNDKIGIIKGDWRDEKDNLNCEFEYTYTWQIKQSNEVENLDLNGDSIIILRDFCGAQIRVHEIVVDYGCGGENEASAMAYSNWMTIRPMEQELFFDEPLPVKFTKDPVILDISSSSGLPVSYLVGSELIATAIGDTIYLNDVGETVIAASQKGNECFLPSDTIFHKLIVEKGEQKIHVVMPDSLGYELHPVAFDAWSSSGLPLSVISSDSTIAYVTNDSLYLKGIGVVSFSITQAGNEQFYAAESVQVNFEVIKGFQHVNVAIIGSPEYGSADFNVKALSNSELHVELKSNNESILSFENDSAIIHGVGSVEIDVVNNGNAFWNPYYTNVEIEILKGKQEIQLLDSLFKKYGDIPFVVPFTAHGDEFIVNCEISNNLVASYQNNLITINGLGGTLIVVSMDENDLWTEDSDSMFLFVDKGDQVLSMEAIPQLTYGDSNASIHYSINSGKLVRFWSNDANIIQVVNDEIEIINAGTTTLSYEQEGDSLWNALLPTQKEITVQKANQQIETALPHKLTTKSEINFIDFNASSGLEINSIVSLNDQVIRILNDEFKIENVGNATIVVSQQGDHNYNACVDSFAFLVQYPTDNGLFSQNIFSIYPNPANQIINIEFGEKNWFTKIELINNLGQVVLCRQLSTQNVEIDVSHLHQGIYQVKLSNITNAVHGKLIVN